MVGDGVWWFATCFDLVGVAVVHGRLRVVLFDHTSCMIATDVCPRRVVATHRLIQVMDFFTKQLVTASRREHRPRVKYQQS